MRSLIVVKVVGFGADLFEEFRIEGIDGTSAVTSSSILASSSSSS